MTRKVKYETNEERLLAIKTSKTKYMLNKPWFCSICDNGHEYSLAGKWMHIKSLKHQENAKLKQNNT